MANPLRGEVDVLLDGRPFVLRYPMQALKELEARLGIDFDEMGADDEIDFEWHQAVTLIWCGLIHADQGYLKTGVANLTEQEVGMMILPDEIEEVVGKALEALQLSMQKLKNSPRLTPMAQSQSQPESTEKTADGAGKLSYKPGSGPSPSAQ